MNVIEQTECKRSMLSFDLVAKKILLRFNNDIIVTCNYFGDQVSLLEDNEVPGNSNVGYQLSDIYVTKDKSHAIYYSRKTIEKQRQGADEIQGIQKLFFSYISSKYIMHAFFSEINVGLTWRTFSLFSIVFHCWINQRLQHLQRKVHCKHQHLQ